jgi:hypothetical protein
MGKDKYGKGQVWKKTNAGKDSLQERTHTGRTHAGKDSYRKEDSHMKACREWLTQGRNYPFYRL